MNLAIDKGNTRLKWALFEGSQMLHMNQEGEDLPKQHCQGAIVCATGQLDVDSLGLDVDKVHVLTSQMRLPLKLNYATPQTLGADRIAAACGALKLCPGRGCVIVDAGTCITVDYMDGQGTYHGGAILPGIEMKFKALHNFTAKLPLITTVDEHDAPVTGCSTQESMVAGVLTATRFAIEGFVRHYRSIDPHCQVILTGGDYNWIWGDGLLAVDDCTCEPHLVMIGLNEILLENEK